MSAGPGWYPDPGDPMQLRYYDGGAWTSHTSASSTSSTGAPSSTSPGGIPPLPGGYASSSSYPGYSAGPTGHGQGQGPGQSQPTYLGAGQGYGHAAPGYATAPGYPVSPDGARASGERWPFVVAGVVVGAALLIVGVVAWGAFSQGWFDGGPTPIASPTSQADPPTIVDGTFAVDGTTIVDVPRDTLVESVVDLPTDGIYLITVTSTDDSDPFLALEAPDGTYAEADYAPAPAGSLGLDGDDAALVGWYTAGPHTVTASDYYGDPARMEVTITNLGEGDGALVDGVTSSIEVPADGLWIGYLDVADGASATLDARTTSGGDLRAALSAWDGLVWENDDRPQEVLDDVGGDSLDPYVTTDVLLEERLVVLVGDFRGEGGTADVTASTQP
ncbi:DUF2510 domain-containing protein [Litorihabitans aurantiacus]|uniref:DUF2510 domain-containing protein n=1 Tax=Litorihabitans aurantiacus TaxID=1930061 RepID=A0AA37XD36_9MICO|nr:DUF2510 domain-containing protein [Litorihabitans aurantiacus]GMA30780.1 hypothetical protein GCM10025875_07720 [Litorihabitans aurantiacus]